MTLYGDLPLDLGPIELSPREMLFWMYCPISLPGDDRYRLPDNLKQFAPIVSEAKWQDTARFAESYVYITAKTLWITKGKNMNRPGWHSDGFGTDDLNYIWSDRAPTEFLSADLRCLSEDCDESMRQMEDMARFPRRYGSRIVTYPDKHLLRLDQSVIHRAAEDVEEGMRTFVKVSISRHRYDLIGNSINHDLPGSHWPLVARQAKRNHPSSETV